MFQVRIHGRGGQGAVTAAEMLSVAAFLEGRHALRGDRHVARGHLNGKLRHSGDCEP